MINRFLVMLNPTVDILQRLFEIKNAVHKTYGRSLTRIWWFRLQPHFAAVLLQLKRLQVVVREGIYRTQCRGIPKPCSICGCELARVVCAKIYGPHRPFSSDKWVATEETWILLWEIITTAGNLDSFIKTTRLTDTNIFELLLLNMN